MFSAALELILNVAYREAAARRHTHLTLEHLLYALAHDPDGEKILAACGGDPGGLHPGNAGANHGDPFRFVCPRRPEIGFVGARNARVVHAGDRYLLRYDRSPAGIAR